MPYALGAINVQAGQSYTVAVGSTGTVGAVVCANESPYAVNASISATGAPGQWIVAQTADLIACDVSGFNGSLTFTTDNYLSNAAGAPSFLLYLTVYAPGEAIRGTYPAPLVRLTSGSISVTTQLVNDGAPSGTQIIEARINGAPDSAITVDNSGNITTNGQINLGPAVGSSYSGILYESANRVLAITSPDAGLSATGILFTTFNGSSITEALSIGAQYGNALAWFDAAGVLHATAPVTLAAGNQETGVAGYTGNASGAGNGLNYIFNFKTNMTNTPTSLTSSNLSTPVNANTLGFNLITKFGANMFWSATAAGISTWAVQYTTVGNCLLAVDGAARTFDHHCDGCRATHRAVDVSACDVKAGLTPLESAMSYACPDCGQMEHFTCGLTAADEADTAPQGSGAYLTTRGAQASLIRALMTARGLEVAA